MVEIAVEPAYEEVIQEGEWPCSSDSVVGTNVCENGNFRGEPNIGEEEFPEKRRKRSTNKPEPERVEKQLVTSVSVFLPSVQFIVNCERDTFFEPIASISSKSNRIAFTL